MDGIFLNNEIENANEIILSEVECNTPVRDDIFCKSMTISDLPERYKWRVKAMLPSDYNLEEINRFQFTEESLYSVTLAHHRKTINDLILKWIRKSDQRPIEQLTITDATAHVGGDSIGFGLFGYKQVFSVELSYHTYKILINNLELFGLDRCLALNADYTKIHKSLEQDIIFIDAPWGGKSVMNKQDVELTLGDINLNDLVLQILENNECKVLVLKVPPGYKEMQLPTSLSYRYDVEDCPIKTKGGKIKFRVIGYFLIV